MKNVIVKTGKTTAENTKTAVVTDNATAMKPNEEANKTTKEWKPEAPAFVHGNPVNSLSVKPEEKTAEMDAVKEPSKVEIKASIAEKIAEQRAILERHIKLGDDLARKTRHRDNLKNIITTLEEFELQLKDNVDETDGNYYQGCLLTIKDDNGKTFTTKNPTIIRGVAEQVNTLCTEKLEEVEMDIVNLIPA
jgi:hypothetical protein